MHPYYKRLYVKGVLGKMLKHKKNKTKPKTMHKNTTVCPCPSLNVSERAPPRIEIEIYHDC